MVDADARRNFGALVAAAFVDGVLSDQERQVLHRKATEMNIPIRQVNDLIARGEQGKLPVAVPPGREAREALLDDLIEVACADGRLEAPEHHLLAKFASHLGLGLPDLRARVRQRMAERTSAPQPSGPRIEEVKVSPEAGPILKQAPPPPAPPAPPAGSPAADIPPVTLQLLKQAIRFENGADALHYVERTMGVTRPEAQRIVAAILAAFPDLKPASR